MSSAIHAIGSAILYLIRTHPAFIMLSMLYFYHTVRALLSHKYTRLSTVIALCFFPPRRDTVVTGKGSLVPLDKLKLLVSNGGSLLMASLLWSLYFFNFSVSTWSNMVISLRIAGYLYVSQLLYLASDESESWSSLEESLVFLEDFALVFLIARREPDFLVMLYSILFWFLRSFISFFHFFQNSYAVAQH